MPGRTRTEIRTYSRDEVVEILKSAAKLELIGSIYRGNIGKQTVGLNIDGSAIVCTTHTPME